MTVHAAARPTTRRKAGGLLILPFALVATLVAAVGSFVAYVLWPTWPNAAIPRDVPAIPITIAGVLFNVPPAAIRATVQRHPGAHERVDLAFLWPSLAPPQTDTKRPDKPAAKLDEEASAAAPANASDRLFVTISGLGATLAPIERLRSIYPRYLEAQATAGPDGLASLPFRGGTPYQGEDLVYVAEKPEQFFARCTRRMRAVPGTCIHERSLDAAEITLRFPREWLDDWRGVAGGFDRLLAELHPRAGDARLKIND